MIYVIDANVLMSALISGKAFYKTVFNTFDLITPDFALIEIEKYKQTVATKSKLNDEQMRRFTFDLFRRLTILPNYFLTTASLTEAGSLIGEAAPNDISYLALALQTDSVLLTRDRPIYVAARQKGFRKIVMFDDFLRAYN
ncbi:PIN domain-containing protein [Spirosoma soli]|uniref:PIN domain-containing protein n=1 Tax=Spirosoma soli TaxID=1770529 RepID=A0ABW5M3J9_9BACT